MENSLQCRACYGVLRFIMESGAKGCEVIVSGKLRGQRAKSMKFVDGFRIHAGHPTIDYIDSAVTHVHLRQGMVGRLHWIMCVHHLWVLNLQIYALLFRCARNQGENHASPRPHGQKWPQKTSSWPGTEEQLPVVPFPLQQVIKSCTFLGLNPGWCVWQVYFSLSLPLSLRWVLWSPRMSHLCKSHIQSPRRWSKCSQWDRQCRDDPMVFVSLSWCTKEYWQFLTRLTHSFQATPLNVINTGWELPVVSQATPTSVKGGKRKWVWLVRLYR